MTRTANPLLFWAPAIMLSLLMHAALVKIIHDGIQADPVAMTEEIRTRLNVSPLDVPAQRAEPREAEGELAEAGEATGERLGVRDVPTSRAQPVTATGQTVAALAADAPITRPARAPAAALPATTAPGARLAAALPDAPTLSSSAALATPVAPAVVPSAIAALAAPPRGEALATVTPDAAALAATAAVAPVLAAATAVPSAIAAAAPSADMLAATESRGQTAMAVLPPSTAMTAAAMPAQALPRARPSGTELAPVSAATARLQTVTAGGVTVSPSAPPATAAAFIAESTTLVASVGAAPALAARPPPALLMAAVAAPSQTVATGRAEAQQVASVQAPPEPVATLDAGSPEFAAPAAQAAPQTTEVAASATSDVAGLLAPTSAADAAVVATAALAWSGGADTVLDEQSLAAIQSFMRPGELSGSASFAGSVRDGIGAALAQFPCSRLQAAFQPDTGGLEIRGHVPTEDMKPAVVGMLANSVGDSIPVGGSVLVLPQPQCGVLDAVENLGLPQSRDQADDPTVVGEEAQASIVQYEEGDTVRMTLQSAGFDAHLYIDYYDGDGNVIHLLPNENRHDSWFAADTPFRIGYGEFGLSRLTAAPPFGQDVAVILGTSTPLYEGALPLFEPADDYLLWLDSRIDSLRSSDPEFRGEWVYIFVMTGPVGAFAGR